MLLPKAAAGLLRNGDVWKRTWRVPPCAFRLGATSHWTMPFVDWAYSYLLERVILPGMDSWRYGSSRDGTPIEKALEKLSKKTIPYTMIYSCSIMPGRRRGLEDRHLLPHKAKQ